MPSKIVIRRGLRVQVRESPATRAALTPGTSAVLNMTRAVLIGLEASTRQLEGAEHSNYEADENECGGHW